MVMEPLRERRFQAVDPRGEIRPTRFGLVVAGTGNTLWRGRGNERYGSRQAPGSGLGGLVRPGPRSDAAAARSWMPQNGKKCDVDDRSLCRSVRQ